MVKRYRQIQWRVCEQVEELIVNSDINPRWLDVAGAKKYASMCDKKLLELVKTGKIYGTKKGGKWIIDRHSIDNYYFRNSWKLVSTSPKYNNHAFLHRFYVGNFLQTKREKKPLNTRVLKGLFLHYEI